MLLLPSSQLYGVTTTFLLATFRNFLKLDWIYVVSGFDPGSAISDSEEEFFTLLIPNTLAGKDNFETGGILHSVNNPVLFTLWDFKKWPQMDTINCIKFYKTLHVTLKSCHNLKWSSALNLHSFRVSRCWTGNHSSFKIVAWRDKKNLRNDLLSVSSRVINVCNFLLLPNSACMR